MSNRALALTAHALAALKKAVSMRCLSSKLQTRARIFDAGLNAAQARKSPSNDSTRTVSPASAPPPAIADSKIHGWWRNSERSLPALKRIVFIGRIAHIRSPGPSNARDQRVVNR